MTSFVRFMVSPLGRTARFVAGIALVAGGLLANAGIAGLLVAAVGLVPLLAGSVDRCVFAPVLGYPFDSQRARQRLAGGASD